MIVLLLTTFIVAVFVGVAVGGHVGRLATLRLRWLPFLYLSAVLGLLPLFAHLSRHASRISVAAGYLLLAVFLVINARSKKDGIRAGLIVILIGWLLNTSAIFANGGMPLSLWAYRASNQAEVPKGGEGGFFKIVIAGPGSRLRMLGDVIPVRPIRQVVSFGDILLVIGIDMIVVFAMRRTESITPN
ncbi:MAG: DUF5317 family protein [Actinomycetota bacterium]